MTTNDEQNKSEDSNSPIEDDSTKPIASWPFSIILILSLIATWIGGLMTWHHESQLYGGENDKGNLVGCEASAEVNCDIVNTSEYSEFLSIPIATWGMSTYLTIAILAGMILSRKNTLLKQQAAKIVVFVGLGTVLYSGFLFYISKSELKYVCAWCMRLYMINASIFVLASIGGGWKFPMPQGNILKITGLSFVAFTAFSVGGQKMYRNSLLNQSGDVESKEKALARLEASKENESKKDNGTKAQNSSNHFMDPEGPPPTLEFQVTTEDKNTATLTVDSDDPWKGSKDAKILIVEYADLECGYCKRTAGQIKQLYNAYKDDVVFVFKHYPLDPTCNVGVKNKRHRSACLAAEAAVCAQEQRRFWDFHDIAFKNQHALRVNDIKLYAKSIGLDMPAFLSCLQSGRAKSIIKADTQAGKALDIHGTPRIFINGKLYRSGNSVQQMAMAIERELGNTGKEAIERARGLKAKQKNIQPIPTDISEMQSISQGNFQFSIDTFESGLKDKSAFTGKHVIPATRMSWYAAKEACEKAGKRLCTQQEWLSACQGKIAIDDDQDGEFADDLVEGNAYPYGEYHDRKRCWDGKNRDEFRPVYTGEMPGCVTDDNVYDMTGNVEEWVGTTESEASLMGGAYDTSKDHARCSRNNDTFGPGYANKKTGFRCCK
jgi:protein-disulfide isomerase/uncharacterized membrane protein